MTTNIVPDDAPIVPGTTTTGAKLKCEFCACQLTPTGDVFRMSQEARDYAKQGEQIIALKAQLEQARADADTFKRERDEANARLAQATGDDEDDDDDF